MAPDCPQKRKDLKAKFLAKQQQQQDDPSPQQGMKFDRGKSVPESSFVNHLVNGGRNCIVTQHEQGEVLKVNVSNKLVSPSIHHPVLVEGVQTNALLDIGSV